MLKPRNSRSLSSSKLGITQEAAPGEGNEFSFSFAPSLRYICSDIAESVILLMENSRIEAAAFHSLLHMHCSHALGEIIL